MSRCPDRRRDDGFSLVEIIVALGILAIVSTALLPQLIIGIRSTGTARVVSQSKGVAQAELERMRNLPFHITPDAGDYRDVLDFYYRNRTVPATTPSCTSASGAYTTPTTGWSGYVASGSSARCSYEPATGAFYRTVREVPASTGSTSFVIVVDAQFLSGATPPLPVSPASGYDTQTTAGARPASAQLAATVTVLYRDRATLRPTTTTTQIFDQPTRTSRIRADGGVTALEVGSVTTANGPVSLSAGLLNLAGSLSYASTASLNLSGVTAGLATGETSTTTSRTVSAPPTSVAAVDSLPPGVLGSVGCQVACWGGTRLGKASVSATQGLPAIGSAASPAQALLTDLSNLGITFGTGSSADYRTGLDLSGPLVRVSDDATAHATGVATGCGPGSAGASAFVSAGGYLTTTGASAPDPSVVETCVVARTASIALFPTTFAPRGVVQVELRRASARCRVHGAAHTATTASDYEAVVRHWDGSGYQVAATVTPAAGPDPLDAVPLTTAVGGGHTLGDYIASWSSLTSVEVATSAAPRRAEVKIPGVVTIATQPARTGTERLDPADPTSPLVDPTSAVSLTAGALSCRAEDGR